MERSEQKRENTWNLEAMYSTTEAWEGEFNRTKELAKRASSFKGTLAKDSDSLFAALSYLERLNISLEQLGTYAFLSYSADSTNSLVMERAGVFEAFEAEVISALSYFDPELMAIDDSRLNSFISEERFKPYRVFINKSRRAKEHVLSEKEEKILALFAPISSISYDTFTDLNNIDLKFEDVKNSRLTHGTYSSFMNSEDEEIRREAYTKYYRAFSDHSHTIARIYAGSVKKDIFLSKARGFSSSLEKALFPDNVPASVYTSLIESVHDSFPILHRYYALRARLLKKDRLKHYDVYVPMVKGVRVKHTYDEAIELIREAINPLGAEYTSILIKGLTEDRWVDRYENSGKRSGAFSSGCYTSMPYILTNYNAEVLSSVFTLIHEGGHSMHSYYSKKNNPYMCHDYTIFEAEVASTFNEQLLQHYLIDNASNNEERAYLIAKQLDDIVATLFRQTMFAEFELLIHQAAESGEAITLDYMRKTYRELLTSYFGDKLEFEDVSDLECLRIPHFYTPFYTYKYATGISAAIALSNQVLKGGEEERERYLAFLKSGGSDYPLSSLKRAGADMSTKAPVLAACAYFNSLIDELEKLTN